MKRNPELFQDSRAVATAASQGKWGTVRMLRSSLPPSPTTNHHQQAHHQRVHNGDHDANDQNHVEHTADKNNPRLVGMSHGLPFALPLSVSAMKEVAKSGKFASLRWIWDHKPDMCPPVHVLFREAVFHSDVDTLRWMAARGDRMDCEALSCESIEHEQLGPDYTQVSPVCPSAHE